MNINIQDHYQAEQTDQTPPIRDLIKITSVAAFLCLFFAGVHLLFLGAWGDYFQMFGIGQGFFLVVLVTLFFMPLVFSQFLPWMESSGLNQLSRAADWGWTLFVVFILYILMFTLNYVLMYIPFFNPAYWMLSAGRNSVMIEIILIRTIFPLILMAVMYGVWWCSFSLMKKLRGSIENPYPSESERRRASQVTKWSFVLSYGAGIAFMVTVYLFALNFMYGLYRGNLTFTPATLFWMLCVYVVTLIAAVALIYAFTDSSLPKYMQRVQPGKLFLSYALIVIIFSLINFIFSALAYLFQRSMPGSGVTGLILMIIFLGVAVWMCKKVLVDAIRIIWIRILAGVLIFLPPVVLTISKARDALSFLLIPLLTFSIIVFILFLISQAIKWALRIVYGAPQDFEE